MDYRIHTRVPNCSINEIKIFFFSYQFNTILQFFYKALIKQDKHKDGGQREDVDKRREYDYHRSDEQVAICFRYVLSQTAFIPIRRLDISLRLPATNNIILNRRLEDQDKNLITPIKVEQHDRWKMCRLLQLRANRVQKSYTSLIFIYKIYDIRS